MKKESDNQRPVIKMKKDAEKEPLFHYSREERLSSPLAPRGRDKRSFFQRNRPRLFMLLNIAIIGVLFALFFLRSGSQQLEKGELAGYSLLLRALASGDSVFVTVEVTRTSSAPPPPSGERVSVRFFLPENGAELRVSDPLPRTALVLRGKLPYSGKEPSAEAEVSIGGETKWLARAVTKSVR